MLLEAAIGDAFGLRFEFSDERAVRLYNDGETYGSHPKHKSIGNGRFSDDTQQMTALAEVIVEDLSFTPEAIAQKFVDVFKRDKRTGYSSRMYSMLCKSENGAELSSQLDCMSERSGSSMRVAPVGIYPTIPEVWAKAKLQAQVTHNTPLGVQAAQAAALMTHYFLYKLGPKSEVGKFIDKYVDPWKEKTYSDDWTGFVGGLGVECVMAAVTAVRQSSSLKECLIKSVAFCGDVDTVAAISMAAASCCDEMHNDLPQSLYDGLENGTYGKDYLINLDEQLKAKMTSFQTV